MITRSSVRSRKGQQQIRQVAFDVHHQHGDPCAERLLRQDRDEPSRKPSARAGSTRVRQPLLRIDATESFVGGELEFCQFAFSKRPDATLKCGPGNGSQLERQGNGVGGRAFGQGGDERRSCELSSIEICRKWNDENRLENAVQGVALPQDDGTTAGLL